MLAPTFPHVDTELFASVANILIGNSANYTVAASGYSGATYDLATTTDLKQETLLADYVMSCTDFNFVLGTCDNLPSSTKLATDKGDFYLYQPYNTNGSNDPTSSRRSSVNWGVFWTTFNAQSSEGD